MIMASWRRQQQQQGETYYQQLPRTKFHNRKPSHPHDSWQFNVPLWEKKFCTSVGSVPWGKLLDTKRCMYMYESIVHWNDSAAEEAFHKAKNRFWAKINGLPCDISLPDPDFYIDEIDWNSSIDPDLVLDLEREPKPSDDETKGEGVILGHPLILNQSFFCTGWGDAEEDFKKMPTEMPNIEVLDGRWIIKKKLGDLFLIGISKQWEDGVVVGIIGRTIIT